MNAVCENCKYYAETHGEKRGTGVIGYTVGDFVYRVNEEGIVQEYEITKIEKTLPENEIVVTVTCKNKDTKQFTSFVFLAKEFEQEFYFTLGDAVDEVREIENSVPDDVE
jgi:hypothetical protein